MLLWKKKSYAKKDNFQQNWKSILSFIPTKYVKTAYWLKKFQTENIHTVKQTQLNWIMKM